MNTPAQTTELDALNAEREALVRFCTRFTRDPHVGEDLAQQTLLEAWRHERQLRDPKARQSWLFSIARNVCLMWARSRRHDTLLGLSDPAPQGIEAVAADDVDLEIELDREELSVLLDRALALLPAETRDVLIQRYIEELPQAEVAARLGVSEGSVEARLHRGKLALRRVLTTTLGEDAVSHGLVAPEDLGRQETRIWCPGCGTRRLVGRLDPNAGRLILTCSGCPFPYNDYINSFMRNGLRGAKTFKPALSRVLDTIHNMYRVRPIAGIAICADCGRSMPIERNDNGTMYLECRACRVRDLETWHSITWSLPEVRRFWRDHPRMRFLPDREIEAEGGPAVVTGFESVATSARLEAVMLRDTLEVLRVERTDAGNREG